MASLPPISSVSGLRAAATRLAVSANDVANVSTSGFKGRSVAQADLAGGGGGGGVRIAATPRDGSQGPLDTTAGGLALAVQGDGFFRVRTERGERFTRAGLFSPDATGRLVTPDGAPLEPEVTIPADARGVAVARDGRILASLPSGAVVEAGQVSLARFANPGGLEDEGGGLLAAGPAAGEPQIGAPGAGAFGAIVSSALEGSNVDLAAETIERVRSGAAFSANLRVIRASDEMLGALLDREG